MSRKLQTSDDKVVVGSIDQEDQLFRWVAVALEVILRDHRLNASR